MKTPAITESAIIDLLARKHSKDIFVPHCKTGPTYVQRGDLLVLDAWAVKKSWTKTLTTGYEVKCSRQDFLNDEKWEGYLPYCEEFYFVCPPKIVLPGELPAEAGLYYVSKTGTKLFLKKKSVRRAISLPVEILLYILMWRTGIIRESQLQPEPQSKKQYWETWLRDRKVDARFGAQVGKAIRHVIEDKIVTVERENTLLREENETFTEVKSLLEKWGLDIQRLSRWNMEDRLRERMLLVEQGIPRGLMGFLDDSIRDLERVKKIFQEKGVRNVQNVG